MVWIRMFWVMAKVEECFERMMEHPKWAVSSQVKLNIIEQCVEVTGWTERQLKSMGDFLRLVQCRWSTMMNQHIFEKPSCKSQAKLWLCYLIESWPGEQLLVFNWNVIKGSWEIHQFKPLRGLVSGRSPSTGALNRKLGTPGRYRQSTAESAAKRAWETPGKCYSNGKPACWTGKWFFETETSNFQL